jgi:predicted regulator of Ras-like GTPase activity (Roadblock/LC7/MglB family)
MQEILDRLNQVAGIKGSMVVTAEGYVVIDALGPDLEKDTVAAVSSQMVKTSHQMLESLDRGGFGRFTLTSTHGRMIFVSLRAGYLVAVTKMQIKLGDILLEIESAARRIEKS